MPKRKRNRGRDYWSTRAADYRHIGKSATQEEVRRIVDHLAMVCDEMSKATNGTPAAGPYDRWIHPNDIVRELTAQRWRMRETEYRAIAGTCESHDGKSSWLTVAQRCAELADYLEKT